MVAYLAGPYHTHSFAGRRWWVRYGGSAPGELVTCAFDDTRLGPSARLSATRAWLQVRGVHRDVAHELLEHSPDVQVLTDTVIARPRQLCERVAVMLEVFAPKLTLDELDELLEHPNRRTLTNCLSADERFVRCGFAQWALRGAAPKFRGTPIELRAVLAAGPQPTAQVVEDLSARFALSPPALWRHIAASGDLVECDGLLLLR